MTSKSLEKLWKTTRPNADLSRLPAEVPLVPARMLAVFLILIGSIWLAIVSGIVFPIFLSERTADIGTWAMAISFPLVGVGMLLFGIFQLGITRSLNISRTNIGFKERSLLGTKSWQEPLSRYQGVRHYAREIKREESSNFFQIIELAHPDEGRTVPLYVQPGMTMPRAKIEDYASALDLPVLGEDGGEAVRQVADLDKSIRELSEEGNFDNRFDPKSAVPAGLKIATIGEGRGAELEIKILASRLSLSVKTIMVVFPFLFGVGGYVGGQSAIPLIAGAIFLGLAVWTFRRDRKTPRTVRLTRDSITGEAGINIRSATPQTLQFDTVEDVFVDRDANGRGRKLVVASDHSSLNIGFGLPAKSLEWLRGYISAAILTA
jgi:hypothetical protein